MARQLDEGILKAFCKYCQNTEIPSIYALWCALSTVSASLGRDCYVDMGHYMIYPNLYVVLVAGSGKCKKSTSIGVAEFFLKRIDPPVKIFAQKATPEALIGSLCGMKKRHNEENTSEQLRPASEGIIIADELSTFIDKMSSQNGMIQFLTTLWDSKDEFEYETKSRGKERILNSCVSLLGGSTISWIKESISLTSIGGGFTARIIFVFQENSEKFILRTSLTKEQIDLQDKIINDLNEASKLQGVFTPTEDAWKMLEEEYVKFMKNDPLHENKYLSGYANKRTTNLLKLCTIVSASYKDTKEITDIDVNTARKILSNAEKFMPKVMMAIASDDIGVAHSYVTDILKYKKSMTRKELLNIVHHRMNAQTLDSIIDTLEQAGVITRQINGRKDVISFVQNKEERTNIDELTFTEKILKGMVEA